VYFESMTVCLNVIIHQGSKYSHQNCGGDVWCLEATDVHIAFAGPSLSQARLVHLPSSSSSSASSDSASMLISLPASMPPQVPVSVPVEAKLLTIRAAELTPSLAPEP
jgi:hypothetical protein